MTENEQHSGEALRNAQGFSLLELMTTLAVLGILATFAFPTARHILDREEAKASASEVAGFLNDARAQAISDGTPHLVYFNPPEVGADGTCAALAVDVRDTDHSYSITAGDETREFKLSEKLCQKVKQFEDSSATPETPPLPAEDLGTRAPDAEEMGILPVGKAPGGKAPGGKAPKAPKGPGPGGKSKSGKKEPRTATVAETVVNGATFPVDASDGRPVIAFSEQGIAVDPADPTAWGSGAGGLYLTDGDSTVITALVAPLGQVQLRVFDSASASWQ